MKVLEKGHIYELSTKLGGHTQLLTFFKDIPKTEEHDGVLCQEVLRALIDRVIELNRQVPCNESNEIIELLRRVLILFETRAARRTLEKCYSKTGKTIEELDVDHRGHVLTFA